MHTYILDEDPIMEQDEMKIVLISDGVLSGHVNRGEEGGRTSLSVLVTVSIAVLLPAFQSEP